MFLFKDKLMSGKIPNKLRFLAKCVSVCVQYCKGMNKRISRLMSWVQNSQACWCEKSATFTVLPNQVERHPAQFSLTLLEARMTGKRGSVKS